MEPDDEEADAAVVAVAEEHMQCLVCYDLPGGIVNQVRRARLPPCPASLPCLPAHLPNPTPPHLPQCMNGHAICTKCLMEIKKGNTKCPVCCVAYRG